MRLIVGVTLVAVLAVTQAPRAQVSDSPTTPGVKLTATAHPPLPGHPSQFWIVPEPNTPIAATRAATLALQNFTKAMQFIADSQYASALPLIDGDAIAATPLGPYGYYYEGVALAALQRYPEADTAFAAAAALRPVGLLSETVPLHVADVALARGDAHRAQEALSHVDAAKANAPEQILVQTGRAAERAGDRDAALKAYRKVYYDYPLSAEAVDAQSGIERLQTADSQPADRIKLELTRAEKLFSAKRYAQSRPAFEAISRAADGAEKEIAGLRIAECDYYLDRFRATRDQLQPFLKNGSRQAEARFFYLTATKSLGEQDTFVTLSRKFIADFPDSPWTEETLNNLASHYVVSDQDDEADLVFRDLLRRFPQSRYSERAAWKVGWRDYRGGNFREAAETFEQAASAFPRSDYRPMWIYWSGRARDQVGDTDIANARFRLTIADYANSYYGRLAAAVMSQRPLTSAGTGPAASSGSVVEAVTTTTTGAAPMPVATDALIRELNALGLYDQALHEVQYAQHVWGNTPPLEATVAWIRHTQGLSLSGTERFNAIRGAITTMRRAYPQFMAAGGENLPPEILRIIFPLDFWPLINRNAMQMDLDPYLIAALMAQESTFTPEIKSGANAVGLMQLLPSTAKRYATKMGIPRFTAKSLTDPEVNVRIGMTYFKELVNRFGGDYYAIASYNAGENRIAKWRADNPNLAEDEFIDDIPFPETQNYVKRILGTAEDYRRLYGGGLLDPNAPLLPGVSAVKRTPPRTVRTSTTTSKKTTSKKATSKKGSTTKKKTSAKKKR